ncbi:unnamed protein product [Calypogeia fissa]
MVVRLNFDEVVILEKENLVLATAAEVEALESKLWIKFPSGYREYMERLGEGCLGGTFVRIYPPWRIEQDLHSWRQRISRYWCWDQSAELLPKERALECVVLGDTGGGDELIFHPCRPDRLFALPHGQEVALEAGGDLLEAIEWMCSSGELAEPFEERELEPFDTRKYEPHKVVVDPDGESLEDIMEMGKRWVERHSAREFKDVHKIQEVDRRIVERKLGRELGSDELQMELVFEAIVLGDHLGYNEGCLLKYSVIDSRSSTKLGELCINHSGDPHSSRRHFYVSES